jgi:hypothetical protein
VEQNTIKRQIQTVKNDVLKAKWLILKNMGRYFDVGTYIPTSKYLHNKRQYNVKIFHKINKTINS